MSTTVSFVSARLPSCLVGVVIDYFGQSQILFNMAELGQYEDCQNLSAADEEDRYAIMQGACYGGHVDIVELMITRKMTNWNHGLAFACQGGNIDIVNLMIAKGANCWNWGLAEACCGGHIDIANLMIAKGANDWNWGLTNACYCGNIKIVNLMIAKGANCWNWSLAYACQYGHTDIANLMIANGATRCATCEKSMSEHVRLK